MVGSSIHLNVLEAPGSRGRLNVLFLGARVRQANDPRFRVFLSPLSISQGHQTVDNTYLSKI